jgi:hypothetical protein
MIKSMRENQPYHAQIYRRGVEKPLEIILKIEPTEP